MREFTNNGLTHKEFKSFDEIRIKSNTYQKLNMIKSLENDLERTGFKK